MTLSHGSKEELINIIKRDYGLLLDKETAERLGVIMLNLTKIAKNHFKSKDVKKSNDLKSV